MSEISSIQNCMVNRAPKWCHVGPIAYVAVTWTNWIDYQTPHSHMARNLARKARSGRTRLGRVSFHFGNPRIERELLAENRSVFADKFEV